MTHCYCFHLCHMRQRRHVIGLPDSMLTESVVDSLLMVQIMNRHQHSFRAKQGYINRHHLAVVNIYRDNYRSQLQLCHIIINITGTMTTTFRFHPLPLWVVTLMHTKLASQSNSKQSKTGQKKGWARHRDNYSLHREQYHLPPLNVNLSSLNLQFPLRELACRARPGTMWLVREFSRVLAFQLTRVLFLLVKCWLRDLY